MVIFFQAENLSAPQPAAMRPDLRSYCPLLTAVDPSAPGVRGPTAAQTGQHHGAATMPAVTASASILQGDEGVFARIEVDDIPKHAARHAAHFALIGPRDAVVAVLRELRAAVDALRSSHPSSSSPTHQRPPQGSLGGRWRVDSHAA